MEVLPQPPPLGAKNYEFSNHLGNVLATVSDRKLWANNGTARIADVKSASDYYPFGMNIGDRTMSLAGYRYGFNGKEKDPSGEWGSQAIYDYGFRIYNPGLGKFLSKDPLTASYPMLTPYQFASNTPIWALDLDGLEAVTIQEIQDFKAIQDKKENYIAINAFSSPVIDMSRQDLILEQSYKTWTSKNGNWTITGTANKPMSAGKTIQYSHTFNGATIYTDFSINGANTKSIFTAPAVGGLGNLYRLRGISRHLVESADPASGNYKDGTILDSFVSVLTERKVSKETKGFSKDAFRHISFSAIMTFLYDSDIAKNVGDAHERDKTGLKNNFFDSTIDIVNNEYGRILGEELKNGDFKGANLGDASTLANFLNRVAKNVTNAYPDLGSNIIFTSNDPAVIKLAKRIE